MQIIIRICTDENDVREYWHNINASLDLDIRVLDDVEAEAQQIAENNAWLIYGEPLHRAREFGVMMPAIDALNERLLSRSEIRNICEMLLRPPGVSQPILPDPEASWNNFVLAVSASQQKCAPVFCPVKKQLLPWIDIDSLMRYTPDPIRTIIEHNEAKIWSLYIFYSFNAAYFQDSTVTPSKSNKLKPMPVFCSSSKYEKRLLHQDDLWKLLVDCGLTTVAKVDANRFDKAIEEVNGRRNSLDSSKVKIKVTFREFVKIILKIADGLYPALDPSQQLTRLLDDIEASGNSERILSLEDDRMPPHTLLVPAVMATPIRSLPPPVPTETLLVTTEGNVCPNCQLISEKSEILLKAQAHAAQKEKELLQASASAWETRFSDLQTQSLRDQDVQQRKLAAAVREKDELESQTRREHDTFTRRITELEGQVLASVQTATSSRQKELEGSLSATNEQLQRQLAELIASKTAADASNEAYREQAMAQAAAAHRDREDFAADKKTFKCRIDDLETTIQQLRSSKIDHDHALTNTMALETRVKELTAQLQQAMDASSTGNVRIAQLEGRLRALESDKMTAKTSASTEQTTADRLRRKVAEAEGALAASDSRLVMLEEAGHKAQEQMEKVSKEIGELTAIKVILEGEIDVVRKENLTLKDEIKQLNKLLGEKTDANEVTAKMMKASEGLQSELAAAKRQLADVNVQSGSSDRQIKNLNEEIQSLQKKLLALTATNGSLDKSIKSALADNNLAEIAVGGLKQQVAELTTARSTAMSHIADLQNQVLNDKSNVENLRVQLAKASDEANALKKNLEDLNAATAEAVAARDAMGKEIDLLKQQVINLTKSNAEEVAKLKQALEQLEKQVNSGNSEYSTMTKKTRDISTALEAANKETESIRQQSTNDNITIKSLKQQLLDTQDQLSREMEEATKLTKRLNDLTAARAALEETMTRLMAQSKVDATEIATSKASVNTMSAAKDRAFSHIAELQNQAKKDQTSLAAAAKRAEMMTQRISELETQLTESNRQSDEAISAAEATIEDQQAQVKTISDDYSALLKKYDNLLATKSTIDADVASLSDQIKQGNNENAALLKQNAELTTAKVPVDKALSKTSGEFQQAMAEMAALSKRLADVTAAAAVDKTVAAKEIDGLRVPKQKAEEEVRLLLLPPSLLISHITSSYTYTPFNILHEGHGSTTACCRAQRQSVATWANKGCGADHSEVHGHVTHRRPAKPSAQRQKQRREPACPIGKGI